MNGGASPQRPGGPAQGAADVKAWGPGGWWRAACSAPLLGIIHVYRATLGPVIGGRCRFTPSCSAYGLDAIRAHGPIRGLWLTARRVCRCHPWGGRGYDPVPPAGDHGHSRPR